MKNKLLSMVRRGMRETWLGSAPTRISDLCVALKPSLKQRYLPPTTTHGSVMPLVVERAGVASLLDQIPSETTKAERRFLYHFFRSLWTGKRDVLEIGPFLGGTTRAMALGMSENVSRLPAARLHTYDRFKFYGGASHVLNVVEPLFQRGVLSEKDRCHISETTSFMEVFQRVHANRPYSELIKCSVGVLPDSPNDMNTCENCFTVPRDLNLDAVFVDGCKGWFATRYFMQAVLPHVEPGAWFLFQDYGQHTCFWLPSFLGAFADAFTLLLYCDSTYAFRLERAISTTEIEERFPPEAEGWGVERFEQLFKELTERAIARDDLRARGVYTVQLAAAMAYIGNKEYARKILRDFQREPWSDGADALIRTALKSPTYRSGPTGSQPIYLDQ